MRFLVRLANQKAASSADRKQLTKIAYDAVRPFGADVGNLRVSSRAVELDLLLEAETVLQPSLKVLEDKMGPILTLRKLDIASPPIDKAEAIRLGFDLFNEERYWESHEALESAWRVSDGPEKAVLQGIILLAAALVHWQKNEREVSISVMRRGLEKFTDHSGDYFGVDIMALKSKVKDILSADQPEFFRIESK
ncbi:hypothetical protein A3K71_01370 [archaeon RBG_16_50_20]|nr:MAG: hypothetical protein A3K71_01370 [archaeon RBG_16_50_20]